MIHETSGARLNKIKTFVLMSIPENLCMIYLLAVKSFMLLTWQQGDVMKRCETQQREGGQGKLIGNGNVQESWRCESFKRN